MSYDGEYDAREYPRGINGPRMRPQEELNDENARLRAQLARANAVIERVGALHADSEDSRSDAMVCQECREVDGWNVAQPCPTRTILAGVKETT